VEPNRAHISPGVGSTLLAERKHVLMILPAVAVRQGALWPAVGGSVSLFVSEGLNPATNLVKKYALDGTVLGALPPFGGNLTKMA
jgi:hypothetical protein